MLRPYPWQKRFCKDNLLGSHKDRLTIRFWKCLFFSVDSQWVLYLVSLLQNTWIYFQKTPPNEEPSYHDYSSTEKSIKQAWTHSLKVIRFLATEFQNNQLVGQIHEIVSESLFFLCNLLRCFLLCWHLISPPRLRTPYSKISVEHCVYIFF